MIKKYDGFVNEGVRDKMTPKSKEDIKAALKDKPPLDVLNGIKDYDLTDLYTEDEMKVIRNRAKRYLNRLDIDDRIEKVGEMDDPLTIYTKDELKKMFDNLEIDDKIEKVFGNDIYFKMYDKGEIKALLDEIESSERFSTISEHGRERVFTEEELDEYMLDTHPRDIYIHLISVVRKGNLDEVKKLVEKWHIDITKKDKRLPEYALESGDVDMVKYLVDKGMNLSTIMLDEMMYYMKTTNANTETVKFVLDNAPVLKDALGVKEKNMRW